MTDKAKPGKSKHQPSESAAEDIDQIQQDLDKARAEAADYLESLQRLKADFDNARKRMLREQSEFMRLASEQLVTELLPVLDNFERALTTDAGDADLEQFRDGVQIVYNQLRDILAKEGLSEIEAKDHEFDPTKHEAMMKIEADGYEENDVVEVLQKGYEFRGKVIRPARVQVAG